MLNAIFAGLGVLLIIAAIAIGVKAKMSNVISKKKDGDGNIIEVGGPNPKPAVITLSILGALSLVFSLSFTIIPTGYTGVRVTFGQVEQDTLPHGFNFHLPVIQQIVMVNNKQQDIRFDNDIVSETSERNEVTFQGITVTYQINPEKSAWIYANVTNYEEGLVKESLVASAIKTTSKTLSPVDCTNRSVLEPIAKENIQKSLDEKYGQQVVYVNKVVISDAKFDEEYDQKIAKKQQAQIDYETQQIENKKNIEKASADAEVRKTQAQAEADARLIAAEAEAEANRKLSESIDSNVLRNKYYENWNGQLPSTIVGDEAAQIMLGIDTDTSAQPTTPKKETPTTQQTTEQATEAPTTESTEE
ncbi:MAG: hypothetical protein K5897_01135 [Eubacterium sp.]|nr:hypothetical protein [Eubacterium sp.]